MRIRCAFVGLLAVGCLSTPARPGGGGGDGGVADARVEPDAGPLEPFPARVVLREYAVADINGDSKDDLLAINADPATADAWGVYILLGRDDGQFGQGYDVFVPTAPVQPMRVEARDVNGAGGTDILVVGRDASAQLWVLVFGGSQAPQYPTSWARFLGPDNANGDTNPYHVTGADLDANGTLDLIVGNIFDAFHVEMNEWSMAALEEATVTPIAPPPEAVDWMDVISVGLYVVDPSRTDVVFARQYGISWLIGFDLVTGVHNTGAESSIHVEIHDVDGFGPPEVLGGTGTQIYVWFAEPEAFVSFAAPSEVSELMVAELSGAEAPEIVTLGPPDMLHVLRDVAITDMGGSTSWPAASTLLAECADFAPTHLVNGDFDGDGEVEILAMAPDGRWVCRRYRASGASAEFVTCGERCP